MEIRNFMTEDPVTASPRDRVGTALRLMRDRDIRHLPLVDGGRLVGIVSDRDLRAYTPPAAPGVAEVDVLLALLETPLGEVARGEVVTLGPGALIGDVLHAILERRVGSICIVDDAGSLRGIVSYIDVLRAFRDLAPPALVRRASEPPPPASP